MTEVKGRLYHLILVVVPQNAFMKALSTLSFHSKSITAFVMTGSNSSDLWYCRLGHISNSILVLTDDSNVKDNFVANKVSLCSICPIAKQHRIPFPISHHKSFVVFDMVHYDILRFLFYT